MKTQVLFDADGNGVMVIGKEDLEGYELPEGASTFAPRYKLVEGVVADSYKGKTDDEVIALLQAAELAKGIALAESKNKVKLVTKLQFMSLFTDAELGAIYAAAKINPAIEAWMDKLKMAEYPNPADPTNKNYINLRDERTQSGIGGLVIGGFLTVERGEQVKAGMMPS